MTTKEEALKVECPWCHASPGDPCFNIYTGKQTPMHKLRMRVQEGAMVKEEPNWEKDRGR